MISHPEFDHVTTATEAAQAFSENILGKNIVIVGVSPSSLGEALALAIAAQKPELLILASRSLQNLQEVATKIQHRTSLSNLKLIVIDLSSQKSIRKAAEEVHSIAKKIDVLINNAAVNPRDLEFTQEGIEMQFGTNHIGHFLFTNLLLPKLREAAKDAPHGAVRIITVTSQGHRISPIRFHDYNFEGKNIPEDEKPPRGLPPSFFAEETVYSPFVSYGQSKTANMLFSLYLSKHLGRYGILSFAVHPGSIWTNLSRSLNEEQVKVISSTGAVWKSQDQGAAPMVVAAFDPALTSDDRIYFNECQLADAAPHANDSVIAEHLWNLSEQLVHQEFEVTEGLPKISEGIGNHYSPHEDDNKL